MDHDDVIASLVHLPRLLYADAAPRWTDAQLVGFADLILRGRVTRVRTAMDDAVGTPYTYVWLDVTSWLKGSARARTVILKQLGGRIGSTTLQIAGQSSFAEGEDVLVFLETRPRDRTLTTTAMWPGKFTISRAAPSGELATRHDPGGPQLAIFGSDVRSMIPWLVELQRTIDASLTTTGSGRIQIAPAETPGLYSIRFVLTSGSHLAMPAVSV